MAPADIEKRVHEIVAKLGVVAGSPREPYYQEREPQEQVQAPCTDHGISPMSLQSCSCGPLVEAPPLANDFVAVDIASQSDVADDIAATIVPIEEYERTSMYAADLEARLSAQPDVVQALASRLAEEWGANKFEELKDNMRSFKCALQADADERVKCKEEEINALRLRLEALSKPPQSAAKGKTKKKR